MDHLGHILEPGGIFGEPLLLRLVARHAEAPGKLTFRRQARAGIESVLAGQDELADSLCAFA